MRLFGALILALVLPAAAHADGRSLLVRQVFRRLAQEPAAAAQLMNKTSVLKRRAPCVDSAGEDIVGQILTDIDEAAAVAVKGAAVARITQAASGPHFAGKEINWVYATEGGEVRVQADVEAKDGVLSLYNVLIKPADAGDAGPLAIQPAEIGMPAMRAIAEDIISRARQDGYRQLDIDAIRTTGASSRTIELTILLE